MLKVNEETQQSYAEMLSQYAHYRETETPDEHMGELLDAFANVPGIAPLFHCSGHGERRMSIMLAVTDVKTLMSIYDDIIGSDSPYIRSVNTELSVCVKRRGFCQGNFTAWKSYTLHINLAGLHEGDALHNDYQVKNACSDLVDIVNMYRVRTVSGSVTNPLTPDRETWTVNYVIPRAALFDWERISGGDKSIDDYILSPILAKRQMVCAFLLYYGVATRTANPEKISTDKIDYHTELKALAHLLENK